MQLDNSSRPPRSSSSCSPSAATEIAHARAISASRPASFEPGPLNAITDVAGVTVGQVTTDRRGDRVRTGVTAILPHGGNLFQREGAGRRVRRQRVRQARGLDAGRTSSGTIETPIVLTNTLAVGAAMDGVVAYTLAQPGNEQRALRQRARRRDERRRSQRHPRLPRHAGARASRRSRARARGRSRKALSAQAPARSAFGWKGGIGTVVAARPDSATRRGRSACSCKPTSAGVSR